MIKDIHYGGLTAQPSDYVCSDGDLDLSLNLVNEDSQINPLSQPDVRFTLPLGYQRLLFIHHAGGIDRYILLATQNTVDPDTNQVSVAKGSIAWITDDDPSTVNFIRVISDDVSSANAVGNILMIFSSDAINYFLWSSDKYKDLGDHIPDLQLSFGLVGHPRLYSVSMNDGKWFPFEFAEKIPTSTSFFAPLSDANRRAVTDQVLAKVNLFIARETVNKGRFCFPFFVRYAIRLYDGSLVCHSAPILMSPSTTACPVVMWRHIDANHGSYSSGEFDIMLVAASLDYKLYPGLGDNSRKALLSNWSDLISGVEVFISKPLYTFDPNGLCDSFNEGDDFDSRFIGRLYHDLKYIPNLTPREPADDRVIGPIGDSIAGDDSAGSMAPFTTYYAEYPYSWIYGLYFNPDRKYPEYTLSLPELSGDKRMENIRDCSTFYHLTTLSLDDVLKSRDTTARTDIVVPDDYLQSLLARETMTDDYLSRERLAADHNFAFNARLNIASVRRHLFHGFSPLSMFSYVSDVIIIRFENNTAQFSTLPFGHEDYGIDTLIQIDGTDYSFHVDHSILAPRLRALLDIYPYTISGVSSRWRYHWPTYIFYPETHATAITFHGQGDRELHTIPLKPHPFLNGSYAVLDYNLTREDNTASFPYTPVPDDPDDIVPATAKVYTSQVNNPFYFPLDGINTVGTGTILGICAAVRPLSQGQFGQFPLYAFTSDGIWALQTNAHGTYSACQPVSRDVCNNPSAITSLDSAVLFPTARGIMMIEGSQTQCISDIIDTAAPSLMSGSGLPGLDTLHAMLGHDDTTCLPIAPFSDFLTSCGILYDYVHRHVIIFSTEHTYAYVYSLKSRQWGMIYSNIVDVVNSYPEALAVDDCHRLVDFSHRVAGDVHGLLVTRPLKLDAPDILKTIDTVIQRGHFRKGHVQSVLYGSRDLFNWHLVWSSRDHYLRGFRGTPYKYFRIALLVDLNPGESIFGATVQFNPRLNDQSR